MIIFNCSIAAASHLYGRYKKGRDEGFFEPSSTVFDSIAERQEKGHQGELIQWVVHAVKIGRSTCLIAMELNTRWVHVIHQVRKGDVNDFVERLNARLINGVEWTCADLSSLSLEEMEQSTEFYFKQHHEIRFYQQTDRSVMSHISQVSDEYHSVYLGGGAFPEDEETALAFDLQLNDTWRRRKGEAFDLRVVDKMIQYWLITYAKKNMAEVIATHSAILDAQRELIRMVSSQMSEVLPVTLYEPSVGHNVIALAEFRKRTIH